MYEHILKPILFRFDPETVHNFFVWTGEFSGRFSILRWGIRLPYDYRGKDISKVVDGIKYRTPFLLSAGFDYNARLINILPCIGFGGEEIGSVTARSCPGNPGIKLTRLPRSQSILVNKGLKNDGVDVIIDRIKKNRVNKSDFILGISIARTNDEKSAEINAGIADYIYSFKRLNEENVGDYYTFNISCPNAFGGESFSDPILLEKLIIEIKKVQCSKPIYIKMPINMPWEKFSVLLDIIDKNGINGVVIGNLNKNYDDLEYRDEAPSKYKGGLSGKPCRKLSTELIKKTREMYGKRFTIIGCGGVMSTETAQEKIDAGADLIQMISGLIFKGPSIVKKMCRDVRI